MSADTKRDEEIRRQYLAQYSHASVRDRYDADLMMAGFADGAAWADAHPPERGPVVVGDATEWEYSVRPDDDDVVLGIEPMPLESARTRANNLCGGWVIVRRRKAGPWEDLAALTPDGQEKDR